jgi:GTP-binding protein
LKVISADFVTSAAAGGSGAGVPRDGLAQVALAGRSNVGKSTLINALCRRPVARTSAAPGKTRLANIYRVTAEGGGPGRWDLYFVDLPGYGYARGGGTAAKELALVAEAYFKGAGDAAAVLLVDSRHPGLTSDRQAFEWLRGFGVEPLVVATKIDKLTRADRVKNLRELERVFGTAALPVSAASGEGLDELWTWLARTVRGTKERR